MMTARPKASQSAADTLRDALGLATHEAPFPWQLALLSRFVEGDLPRSLDIPTGLGKTAVMAIWLIARAHGANLPRRLVYVVDRRAVVDQATEVAVALRGYLERTPHLKSALDLGTRALPISTLRGQFVDNKEWLENPASPAIVVGTVDMIGSRLLFEGYGVSRKMRPYHAAFLGVDTLVVLDESHLVPPFEKLLTAIVDGGATFGARDETRRELIPPFRLLSLSATSRTESAATFGLTDQDLEDRVVRKRLQANKHLSIVGPEHPAPKLAEALAARAWKLAGEGTRRIRCLVFSDRRKDADLARQALEKLARGAQKPHAELFVGGRRVFERQQAAAWLRDHGFIAGTDVVLDRPAFLFGTSAAEVGVDLDAEHMVCDVVAWERMIQRLGRVNRRGDGAATVIAIVDPPSKEVQKALEKQADKRSAEDRAHIADAERKSTVAALFRQLPSSEEGLDVSPEAFRDLKLRAGKDPELRSLIEAATTPPPLRPALSRPLVDAWSMTSLEQHTGRPEIQPWIRGWLPNDPPQTRVIWRKHLPVRTDGTAARKPEVEEFFEAAPPHTSEVLDTETYSVVEWLIERAQRLLDGSSPAIRSHEIAAIVLSSAGEYVAAWRLAELALVDDAKRKKEVLEEQLANSTLVVDLRVAGLKDGLLNEFENETAPTGDDPETWQTGEGGPTAEGDRPLVPFRARVIERHAPPQDGWLESFRLALDQSAEGEPTRWLVVETWRDESGTDDGRSLSPRAQLLDDHQEQAEQRADNLAGALQLPTPYKEMLRVVARLHDEGKRAPRWQKAFKAPKDGEYAKTRGPIHFQLLDGYRHEFTSVARAAVHERVTALPDELRDLTLHLIAAHHGFARPVIGISGCDDAPPSALEGRAQEIAFRFARLQRVWGPWGLAWWESLLRAVDQQASRDNDQRDSPTAKEPA